MNKLLKVLKKSGIVKSSVAALLAMSVLLTTFAGMSIFGQGGKLTAATEFASGTGTSADPYMIENASELLLAVTSKDNAGVYYKLANDIYINKVDSADWYTKSGVNEWVGAAALNDADAFKGNFNGDGFKVYGLYIKEASSDTAASTQAAAGLFPIVGSGAVITAVGVENAYVSLTCAADAANGGNLTGVAGALIGATTSASPAAPVKVSLCYVDAETYLEGGFIGGIIGDVKGNSEAKSVIIENCYSNASGNANRSGAPAGGVSAEFGQYNRMGIIGVDHDNNGNTVYMTGCYTANGNVSGTGIRADEAKSNYCTQWSAGAGQTISADLMFASGAKANMPLLDFENVYKTTSSYPALRIFDREFADEVLSYEVWDGTAEKPTKGTGTPADPFIIENAQQFAWAFQNQPKLSDDPNQNWPAYKLMTDIYLNNLNAVNWETGAVRGGYEVRTWTPGEVFIQMDGNGHMVYGLYVNRDPSTYSETGSPAGLIGLNKSNQWESFKNLGVDKAYIHTDGSAGVFIGKMMGSSARATIDRCYVGPDVTIKGFFVSSFVGYGPAVIRITNSANTTDNMTAYKYSEANRDRFCGILGGGVWGGSNVINNSYSVTYLQPNGGESGVNVDNSYGTKRHFQKDIIIELDKMQGFDALTNAEKMPSLGSAFKATETFPVPAVLYEAVTGLWDGTVADKADVLGTGTEADPFIIDTPSKAALMVLSSSNDTGRSWYNGHYKITKDLYLNDVEAINWSTGEVVKEGYVPNVWVSSIATDGGASTVHGDNHVIRGLYVNDTATDKKHAFWTYSYSGVKMYDLGFDNAFVKAKGPAGIIFSNAKTGGTKTFVFEGCYVGENATVISTENSAGAFYAWGAAANMTFKNCYSVASVSGAGKTGSFATDVWGNTKMTFENCYGLGAFRLNTNNTWTYKNSYCDVAANGLTGVSAANMKGMDALTAENKMPNLGDAYAATEGYPVLKAFPLPAKEGENEEEDSKFWDGSLIKPNEGSGTVSAPFLIDTAEELAWSMNNAGTNAGRNMFYKLTADIYLNDVEKINWSTGAAVGDYAIKQWNPKYFSGTFDGDFHVIYGLYADKKPDAYVQSEANGLGFVSENEWNNVANFKNLGLDYVYFNGPSSVGALAGNVKTGNNGKLTADRVFVGANVFLKGHSVGGFIGYGAGALNITNSYSLVTNMTDTANKKAGIIGNVWNGTNKAIDNCYALNRIYGNNKPEASFTNVFCVLDNAGATVLSASEMKGLKVMNVGGKLEALGDAFQATISYPIIKGFENTVVDDGSAYWDGSVSKPAAGTGVFGDPYQITNGAELAWAVNNSENGKYYKVMNDIYLNDIDAIDWTTGALKKETYGIKYWNGGNFEGTLDGNGKVVYGMYINNNATSGKWGHNGKALITAVDGTAVIEKLGIDNAYVCNTTGASAFVGSVNTGGSASFKECYVGEKVVLKGYLVGGFTAVSQNPVTVSESYNAMPLENYILFDKSQAETPKKGGILGDCWAGTNTVIDSWSFETIRTNNGNLTRVYSSVEDVRGAYTPIAIENMKGLDALSSASKMSGLAGCGKFMATDSYPVLKVFVEGVPEDVPEGDVWSGNVASTFAGGMGTKDNPYLIANGAQLALAISKGGVNGSYFKLTKDIYLNDVTEKQWAKNTDNKVWLTNAPAFNGSIDGDGYIIYGLYIPESAAPTSAGLITSFQSGTIKNLGMRYAYVRGNDLAAALVAKTASGGVKYIDQCFADDTCDVAFIGNVYGGAAGIVGYAQPEKTTVAKTFITNCYSKAKLSAAQAPDQRANGIIGTAWWSSYSIKNCYSYGAPVYFGANAGTSPWCLYQDGEEAKMDIKDLIDNVYTDARAGFGYENMVHITPREDMTDETAKTTMPALDFENIWETVTETSPKLQIFTSISGEETDLSKDSEIYASGKGTKKSPYIIMNEAQLRYLLESGNTKNKYYKLGADIYLNDVSKPNWKTNSPNVWYHTGYSSTERTVPNFEGIFNGDGHTIYGLFVNETPVKYEDVKSYVSFATGLFPMASTDAKIYNTHIRNSYISGKGYAGSIVGFIQGSSSSQALIMGCSADESVTVKGQTTGGMVGGGTGGLNLYYSYFTGKLEATAADLGRQGGLVGDIWHTNQTVAECYTIGYANYRPGYTPANIINIYGTVTQSGTTLVSETQMYGSAAKTAMSKLSWGDIWYVANGKTPQLKVLDPDMKLTFNDEGVKGRPWSGLLATKFAGGSGTEADPYLIETPEQMAYLVSIGAKSLDNHYKLACDLVINDTTKAGWEQKAHNWLTGGDFGGHFDGDGHVISGLYFNGSATHVALFPKLTGGAVVEKLGIINSTLISNVSGAVTQTYVAPFGAYYSGWENETHGWPVISQCFADDTVYLEGFFVGGIVCGSPKGYHIDNCFFTGEITAQDHHGTMIGNIWSNQHQSTITTSYGAAADRNKPSSNNAASSIICNGYYHDGVTGTTGQATPTALLFMQGQIAKENMPLLDYDKIWMIVEGGTPVLRCFKDAKQYSCTREPAKVEIAFVTGEGTPCEPIYGLPAFDKIPEELPVPERYGYDFGGWYFFEECDIPFDLEIFPEYDCYVYAKWIQRGYTQGFEGKIDETYDFNESAVLFKPGVAGYNPRYVHGGLRSVQTLSDGETQGMFLISYDNMVKVGNKYDVIFWMNTGTEGASGALELLHANHGQVDSDIVGYETVLEFTGLKAGVWQQYKFTTTANAPFFIMRAPAGVELYFDDFQVVDIAEEGVLGELEGFNPMALGDEPIGAILTWILSFGAIGIVVLVAAGVLGLAVIAAAIIVIVLVIRKKSKKKKAALKG